MIAPAFSGMDVGKPVKISAPLCAKTIVDGNDKWIHARSTWYVRVVGRLKPGVDASQASARLEMLTPGLVAATLPPNWPPDVAARYQKAQLSVASAAKGFSALPASYNKALVVLMTVVGIVLLIASLATDSTIAHRKLVACTSGCSGRRAVCHMGQSSAGAHYVHPDGRRGRPRSVA
ncbi:MAG: hypothetical protein ABI119_01365 [Gemmatimonadaceae bacterium]